MGGEASVALEIPMDKVFVVSSGASDACYEMVGKMITALKYRPEEVALLEESGELLENLEAMDSSKKILFFGKDLPGSFGHVLNWAGHQVVQTHSVPSLLETADLKKETWAHLKMFAGI